MSVELGVPGQQNPVNRYGDAQIPGQSPHGRGRQIVRDYGGVCGLFTIREGAGRAESRAAVGCQKKSCVRCQTKIDEYYPHHSIIDTITDSVRPRFLQIPLPSIQRSLHLKSLRIRQGLLNLRVAPSDKRFPLLDSANQGAGTPRS